METDMHGRIKVSTLIVDDEWWVLQSQCPRESDTLVNIVQQASTRPQ